MENVSDDHRTAVIGGSCCCCRSEPEPWYCAAWCMWVCVVAVLYLLGAAVFSLFEWELEWGISLHASLAKNVWFPAVMIVVGAGVFLVLLFICFMYTEHWRHGHLF